MAVNLTSNTPKPYTLLTRVKSESGNWEYEIRTSHRDGHTYCTCKGFTFHQKCKHMDAYREHPIVNLPAAPALKPKARTPGDVLREELEALGLPISQASANAISVRVLSAAGKVGSAASGSDTVNADNVRVIILPD